MLRRLFIGFLSLTISGSLSQAQSVDGEQTQRWIEFHHVWFKFLSSYFGCPPGLHEHEIGDCRGAKGNLDYDTFNKARNLAKKIFDLEEKRG